MRELHWALRGSVYGEAITQNNIEFVVGKIQEQEGANSWNYAIDLNHSCDEVERLLSPGGGGGPMAVQEPDGLVERSLSDMSLQGLNLPFIGICLLLVLRLRE
jgi:hypothetical protein